MPVIRRCDQWSSHISLVRFVLDHGSSMQGDTTGKFKQIQRQGARIINDYRSRDKERQRFVSSENEIRSETYNQSMK